MTGRLYVRCLAAYNNGILHGSWIDTSTDVDEMKEAIDQILKTSPIKGAEEWAVHDFENMPVNLGEYPQLKMIAAFESFVEENGHIIREDLVAIVEDANRLDDIDMENLAGIFDEFSDYSDEAADELLATYKTPDAVRTYFDYEAFGRDLKLQMHTIDVPSGVAVFYQ